jgi:hypothetical protein
VSTDLEEDAFLSEKYPVVVYNDTNRRMEDLIKYLKHIYSTIFDKPFYSLEILQKWVSVFQQLFKLNIIV